MNISSNLLEIIYEHAKNKHIKINALELETVRIPFSQENLTLAFHLN